MFQNYNLFANKTAIENILEGLVIARKVPKAEAFRSCGKSASEELVYRTNGIAIRVSFQGASAAERIGIARAIAVKPPCSSCLMSQLLRLDPELIGVRLSVHERIGTGRDYGW